MKVRVLVYNPVAADRRAPQIRATGGVALARRVFAGHRTIHGMEAGDMAPLHCGDRMNDLLDLLADKGMRPGKDYEWGAEDGKVWVRVKRVSGVFLKVNAGSLEEAAEHLLNGEFGKAKAKGTRTNFRA
jgi:hypothetical protein